jgi:hypothetical protein
MIGNHAKLALGSLRRHKAYSFSGAEGGEPQIVDATRIMWDRMKLQSGERRFREIVGMADGSLFSEWPGFRASGPSDAY